MTALRDEADIVITNPPFSLFRAFVGWLVEGGKTFSLIGNSNATTYVEIFPLIQRNELWKGATANSTDMVFGVPKGFPLREADRAKAERMGYPSTDEHDFTRLGNACWFTNIDHGRRHEPLQLMTMDDNVRFSKHKDVRGVGHQHYYNFPEAIEVPWVDAIPSDCDGVMGHQPRVMTGVNGAGHPGRAVRARRVQHPGDHGQPDLRGRGLRGPLDGLQHPDTLAGLVRVEQRGGGMHQPAGLLGRGRTDLLGQHAHRVRVAEPPSPPVAGTGGAGRFRRPAGIRAVHSASLIST